VARPFALAAAPVSNQSSSEVTLRTIGERVLSGYPVASNSTGMIHSEQMLDLQGAVSWQPQPDGTAIVENRTGLLLSGVAVIRRRFSDATLHIETAWLGSLPAGATARAQFEEHDVGRHKSHRDADPLSAERPTEGSLNLRRLIDSAENHSTLAAGETRLVAWHAGAVAGAEIRPAAGQARRAVLVVAHLEFNPGTPPLRDVNLRAKVALPEDLLP
jgi:hypothetical protein